MKFEPRSSMRLLWRAGLATGLGLLLGGTMIASATTLADQPVFSTSAVPGNLALALSVEWPTASRTAHTDAYTSASTYLGYFDPNKCYLYQVNTTANSTNTGDSSYFYPAGLANPIGSRTCTGADGGKWSGNFLNWAATPTIDPFRWAMTGGRRVGVGALGETATETFLEKAWNSGQGLFPDRNLTVGEIAGATPYNGATALSIQVNGLGYKMRLNATGGTTRTMNATYFNNILLTGQPTLTVPDDNAFHDWGSGSPGTGVNSGAFSARFVGTYTASETGNYYFRTRSDDGVRVWVDTSGTGNFVDPIPLVVAGNRVINNWTNHGSTIDTSAAVALSAGQSFSVRVDYFDSGGDAVMELSWQKPSTPGTYVAFNSDPGNNDFTMRTKVCDPSLAAGGIEANCKAYGANYKPEGLIQKYSQKIRFSAFGYLNDDSDQRDGGVMRAQQKFVGPTIPVPGAAAQTNAQTEWSSTTGVMASNPDGGDATATNTNFAIPISDSGVMNYLNKFGQLIPGNYKSYDPVSEMYYAVVRYFKNQGNVAAWSSMTGADADTKKKWADGFPVITNWGDPIQYSCQRNFILGIGDIYTHVDKDVAGNATYRVREPGMPTEIAADGTVNAITATNKVGQLQGVGDIGATNDYSGRNNSAYIAGLAYDSHTKDIRPDAVGQANTVGKQTIETFWVDVLEAPFAANNQFYLAAKFGGLNDKKLPAGFDPYTFAGTIPVDWWSTNGETLTGGGITQPRPDNYYAAGRPDTMVTGLTDAFNRISDALAAFTTSFSLSTVQVSSLGAASYAAQYDPKDWSGEVTASNITFAADGTPASSVVWSSTAKLATQFADPGWNTGRRVVTWNGTAGAPFRIASLTTAQAAALDTSYVAGDDRSNYLNYLRGERTNERTDADTSKAYRKRGKLLGDIVNAKVTPVGAPAMNYSDAVNPGYAAFKTAKAGRQTMVYAAANDGMLHAFVGGLTDAASGTEQFAYVPSATYLGPSAPSTPQVDGLAQLGNPNYVHHYYVDATPDVFDIDFNYAGGVLTTAAGGGNSRWRSVLIGGMGKGGKSFYAIDVTDPGTMTSETTVASKVLWEFTDPTMGFSFGEPIVVKTKRYGWVVVLTSGYNNSDGKGYLYFVNPETGVLLQKVSTGTASNGLTHASGYIQDFTDGTVDAFYAGDLDGQLWRFDVTSPAAVAYPAPTKLAVLTSALSGGVAQPITTQPLIEIQPLSRKRYVMVGTGQLLDPSDISSAASQSFYAILDGTATAFRPADGTMPITRSQLTALTDLTVGVTVPATSQGWYLDLGSSGGVGLRVVSPATAFNGIVAFSSLLTTGDACTPSGTSRIYAIDFGTGKSALTPVGTAYVAYSTAITDLKFVGVDRVARLISGDVLGVLRNIGFTPPSSVSLRLLNWREVPTVD